MKSGLSALASTPVTSGVFAADLGASDKPIELALKLADCSATMRDGKFVQIGTPEDIVLRPVDDYVLDFTRDVPKGRHACVEAVMLDQVPATMPEYSKLRVSMTLSTALEKYLELHEPVPVLGAEAIWSERYIRPSWQRRCMWTKEPERSAKGVFAAGSGRGVVILLGLILLSGLWERAPLDQKSIARPFFSQSP